MRCSNICQKDATGGLECSVYVIRAQDGRDIFSDICQMFDSVLSIYKYRLFGTQRQVWEK